MAEIPEDPANRAFSEEQATDWMQALSLKPPTPFETPTKTVPLTPVSFDLATSRTELVVRMRMTNGVEVDLYCNPVLAQQLGVQIAAAGREGMWIDPNGGISYPPRRPDDPR